MVQTAAAPAGRGGEEAPHDPDRGTETARPAKEVSTIPQTALWVYNVTNSSVCASCHSQFCVCIMSQTVILDMCIMSETAVIYVCIVSS